MAKRYSGQVSVRLEYKDSDAAYHAWVTWPEGREKVIVNEPRYLTRAVDSPEAHDEAARAAISFTEENGGASSYAEWGLNEIKISRVRGTAGFGGTYKNPTNVAPGLTLISTSTSGRYLLTFDRDRIRELTSEWPASGMDFFEEEVRAEFEPNGDLVDLEVVGEDGDLVESEAYDGPAMVALLDDGQCDAARAGFVPKGHCRSGLEGTRPAGFVAGLKGLWR